MMHSQQLNNSAHSQSASNGSANRPPPTPTYFNHPNSAATPTQQQFPFSTGPSPSQHATGLGLTQQQITPANSSDSVPTLQQMHSDNTAPHYARPYGSYPLPNMASSMMPSIHSVAAGQMPLGSMNGGMMSGYGNIHSMYGSHHQQTTNTPTDRPFKCDQCVQSFNRNHDLKRHKRIHLAVKPFPCGHCDKSFSRKDALKVSYLSLHYRTSLTIPNRGTFLSKAVTKLQNLEADRVTQLRPTASRIPGTPQMKVRHILEVHDSLDIWLDYLLYFLLD